MTKGTTSQGPRNDKTHTTCRRCGRKTFHRQHKSCGACGYPRAKTRRCKCIADDGWGVKVRSRKGEGSGRMRYLKDVPRRARHCFRSENNFVKAIGGKKDTKGARAVVPRRKLK